MIYKIPGHKKYYASKDGFIYSSKYKELRKLSGCINSAGYRLVSLSGGNKKKSYFVHDLILKTFFGEKKPGFVCRHGRLGKLNNSIKNISYGTYSQNNYDDRRRDKTLMWGTAVHTNKLSIANVLDIRKRHSSGIFAIADIARRFNITEPTTRKIIKRELWKEVV